MNNRLFLNQTTFSGIFKVEEDVRLLSPVIFLFFLTNFNIRNIIDPIKTINTAEKHIIVTVIAIS